MYTGTVTQIVVSDTVSNFLLFLLYSRIVKQKSRLLLFFILAVIGAWVGGFMVDLIQSVFLLVFGLYRLIRRRKWLSFNTLVFIFILSNDMVLANCSTFIGHLVFKELTLSWPNIVLTTAINALFYLILLMGYPLVEARVTTFKNTNLVQPALLKIVINFALTIFLAFQFIQFTADVLDIAVFFQWLLILFTAFFIGATVVVMVYFIRTYQISLKQKAAAQAQANLAKYTNELAANYQQLRKFKHDYQNILLSLSGYIEQTAEPELKTYYQKIVAQTNQTLATDNLRFDGLEQLQLPALRSLTYHKLATARQLNIATHLEVREPITTVPVDIVKLVRVLGILFDNALEAARQQERGVIRIAYIQLDANEQEIVIQNTLPTALPLAQLFKDTYTTKGGDHGAGLVTVKQIIDQTPNMALTISQTAGEYRVVVSLIGE
ncbi:sensor histidine kinase [Loigolactobacillus binensis]|uniref:Sensor histidine kinase n=1 Tax=Loigolactobacillus binensis TaxID=2559922 RepID=A0ABW3EBQ3_9LACO|nr:GHKL domain-containing protein [Loigolactobacillus binensis]